MKSALLAVVLFAAAAQAEPCVAQDAGGGGDVTSLADNRFQWPTREHLARVLLLRDYNTRVVLLGTGLLGVVAGVVGSFMLLRQRSLVGDVVSHASLPGIAIAFLLVEALTPGEGRRLPSLLMGALTAGLIGVGCVVAIRRFSRIKEDAALAIVLSVFFGLGIVLFSVVQRIPTSNVAGLQGFIFGKAAALVAGDVWLIAAASLVVLAICAAMFKEFTVLCFDDDYAASMGWPVVTLDLLLMGLVAVVTVIGLESVGLLLVVALLITPAVSARFWTDHLPSLVTGAGILGGLTALIGTLASALFSHLPTGAIIVLVGCAFFIISMLGSIRHGAVRRWLSERALERKIDEQHLLRSCFEFLESVAENQRRPIDARIAQGAVPLSALLSAQSWSPRRLHRLIGRAERGELVYQTASDSVRLTTLGWERARQIARNHRLWELYLIQQADVAPTRVDRYADMIEHVLEPELIKQLEIQLADEDPHLLAVPPSPHELTAAGHEERLVP